MAHSPSALAQHHLDTAPFFDSTNLPNSDEDLVVEFSVPVNTVNSSGQTVSVLHLPLQVPQEQLALDDTTAAVQLHQEHERHQTTSLTSSSVTGPCSRPGTPVPREPAEEGSLGERHLLSTHIPAFRRTSSVQDIQRHAGKGSADQIKGRYLVPSGHHQQPVHMLPGFIEDQVAHLRAAAPTRVMPVLQLPAMPKEANEPAKYKVTYRAIARQSVELPSHQEVYDTALNHRSPELDELREELGIELGNLPVLPPKSDPRQRAWAKPLVARFYDLIGQEMRRVWIEARELALNTVANAGVDMVPVVKPVTSENI